MKFCLIQCKLVVKAKDKLKQHGNGQKMRCNADKDIAQLIENQKQ